MAVEGGAVACLEVGVVSRVFLPEEGETCTRWVLEGREWWQMPQR